MTKISVILPFHNADLYLRESISSILNQTYGDFELLLLDDGSTDRSIDIVQQFNDNRIIYLREEENKGIVYQLNKGIDISRGQFIARMDADDICHPERFKKQIEFFEKPENKQIDVLGTNAIKIGTEEGKMEFKNYKPRQISFLLNFYCPILHPTIMLRKKVLEKNLRFSEEFRFAEDFAMWKRIDNGKNIAIIPDILLEYRIHNNQTNKNNDRLSIQYNSCLKVLNIRSTNIFDRIFISSNVKKRALNNWFGMEDQIQITNFNKYYIKFIKNKLQLKSNILNFYS